MNLQRSVSDRGSSCLNLEDSQCYREQARGGVGAASPLTTCWLNQNTCPLQQNKIRTFTIAARAQTNTFNLLVAAESADTPGFWRCAASGGLMALSVPVQRGHGTRALVQ